MVLGKMTRLTIAVPNFNGSKNLQRTIKSCKKIQIPLQDYEILIADNCSTDNSIDIINAIALMTNFVILQALSYGSQ